MHTGLVGAAGEYYVAAELSRRDWLATVTIKNSPGTDVLAKRLDGGSIVALQVKTASSGYHFRLNQKDERITEDEGEWYALVGLKSDDERPDFYLVPRNVVATLLFLSHREWLAKPGRGGQKRNDNPIRQIYAESVAFYHEKWDLLQERTSDVPYELPHRRDAVKKHGLPELGSYRHPWAV